MREINNLRTKRDEVSPGICENTYHKSRKVSIFCDRVQSQFIKFIATSMRLHLPKSNEKSAESALEPSKFRYALALAVLCVVPTSKGLSVSRSRAAFSNRGLVRPLQISKCRRLDSQKSKCIKSYWSLRSRDSASLGEISATDPTVEENANATGKIEEEIQQEQEAVSQQIEQEKEELQVAVNEVKEAVVEVSQSAKNLGGTFITKVPSITSNFVKLWASEAFRLVNNVNSILFLYK